MTGVGVLWFRWGVGKVRAGPTEEAAFTVRLCEKETSFGKTWRQKEVQGSGAGMSLSCFRKVWSEWSVGTGRHSTGT